MILLQRVISIMLVLFSVMYIQAGCANNQLELKTETSDKINNEDWKRIETSNFSFSISPDLEFIKKFGTDNEGWLYESKAQSLYVTLGTNITEFSKLKEKFSKESEYSERKININGKEGIYYSYLSDSKALSKDKRFCSGIYFEDALKPYKLFFQFFGDSQKSHDIGLQIFQSIEFKSGN